MEQLFTNLSHAVEGAPLIALGAAVVWGILSIVLSPCHLASIPLIVGFTFKLAKTAPWYGASLLLAYGIGHCAVIVLAGTSTEVVQKFLNWNETSKAVTRIKGVCGALVVSGGIWMIYTAP